MTRTLKDVGHIVGEELDTMTETFSNICWEVDGDGATYTFACDGKHYLARLVETPFDASDWHAVNTLCPKDVVEMGIALNLAEITRRDRNRKLADLVDRWRGVADTEELVELLAELEGMVQPL